MRVIDYNELFRLIRLDPSLSYIATAVTPWHAVGVVASVISQGLQFRRGIILIIIHETFGKPLIDNNNFIPLNNYVEIYVIKSRKLSGLNKMIGLFNSVRFAFHVESKDRTNDVYFISQRWVDIHKAALIHYNLLNVKLKAIFYDEGLATYFPVDKVELKRNLVALLRDGIISISRFIYLKRYKCIDACLFKHKVRKVHVNRHIIPCYKKAITLSSKAIAGCDLSVFEDSVIICPNAWNREFVDDNADTKVVLLLIERLTSRGIRFVIKLHPRDTWGQKIYNKYSCSVYLTTSVSMEAILSSINVKPRALIGFSSTILVTAKLFYDLKVINIANLVDDKSLGVIYRNEKLYFTNIFGDYVISPKSICEILKYI